MTEFRQLGRTGRLITPIGPSQATESAAVLDLELSEAEFAALNEATPRH